MRHFVVAVISGALFAVFVSFASGIAGPFSDDLGKCLVRSTTDADKNYLVKWMFASAALHPAVKSIASVSDAERTELNRNTARLVEKLLTESCRSETQQAVKNEGPGTLQASFQILGQVAGRGLFTDPAVARSMASFEDYLDKPKLEALFGPK